MQGISRRGLLASAASVATVAALGEAVNVAPSHAAAPQVGKQVPGWYRQKLGDFEVTVVTDGRLVTPLAETYVVNAKKDAVNEGIAANYLPKDAATHDYTPLVINTGSKLVAIDTGLGGGVHAQSKGAAGQYHTNLAASGIDAKTVDAVVISHFHGDHINGLVNGENKPIFVNAEVMVPAIEWKFWMDDANMSKAAGTPLEGVFKNARRVMGGLGNKVTQYEDGKELVPGIKAIATPGHTLGHMSYLVSSGPQNLIVQSDVTAGMAFLFVKNPEWQLMFDMDKPLAVQSRRKIYDQAVADRTLIHGFHLPFPGLGYMEKDGNGYRFVPATWNSAI